MYAPYIEHYMICYTYHYIMLLWTINIWQYITCIYTKTHICNLHSILHTLYQALCPFVLPVLWWHFLHYILFFYVLHLWGVHCCIVLTLYYVYLNHKLSQICKCMSTYRLKQNANLFTRPRQKTLWLACFHSWRGLDTSPAAACVRRSVIRFKWLAAPSCWNPLSEDASCWLPTSALGAR